MFFFYKMCFFSILPSFSFSRLIDEFFGFSSSGRLLDLQFVSRMKLFTEFRQVSLISFLPIQSLKLTRMYITIMSQPEPESRRKRLSYAMEIRRSHRQEVKKNIRNSLLLSINQAQSSEGKNNFIQQPILKEDSNIMLKISHNMARQKTENATAAILSVLNTPLQKIKADKLIQNVVFLIKCCSSSEQTILIDYFCSISSQFVPDFALNQKQTCVNFKHWLSCLCQLIDALHSKEEEKMILLLPLIGKALGWIMIHVDNFLDERRQQMQLCLWKPKDAVIDEEESSISICFQTIYKFTALMADNAQNDPISSCLIELFDESAIQFLQRCLRYELQSDQQSVWTTKALIGLCYVDGNKSKVINCPQLIETVRYFFVFGCLQQSNVLREREEKIAIDLLNLLQNIQIDVGSDSFWEENLIPEILFLLGNITKKTLSDQFTLFILSSIKHIYFEETLAYLKEMDSFDWIISVIQSNLQHSHQLIRQCLSVLKFLMEIGQGKARKEQIRTNLSTTNPFKIKFMYSQGLRVLSQFEDGREFIEQYSLQE